MAAVKAKYKELAKRHHPDANGGNKASEETLKSINLAYATLRGKLPAMASHAAQPAPG
jgi:curved DNA-binding protein CbpA